MISNKSKALLLSLLLLVSSYDSTEELNYSPTYEIINEDNNAFATYSKGRIFIGDLKFISSLNDIQKDDIFVVDYRNNLDNPSFKILNSAFINDKNIIDEVLEVLCEYEKCYPSNWNRTIESMRVEWLIHNLSYYVEFQRNKAKDVDLDNQDEKLYNNKVIRKILKL